MAAAVGDKEFSSDSEDEYYDPEEEAQREIDDSDFNFGGVGSYPYITSCLLTHNEIQERINLLERRLAEITAKAQDTNTFTVFDERGMTEVALNKVYEDLDYFNVRFLEYFCVNYV